MVRPTRPERRASARNPAEVEPTYVWVSLDRRIPCRAIDESEGGIAVIVSSAQPFELGFQVRVEVGELKRTARIVYTKAVEDGFRIGLAWE